MQLSYCENDSYFLSMDSSTDGNMYLKLYRKVDQDNGEKLFQVKITDHNYKRGSQMYHEIEDKIKKDTLNDNYIEETRNKIAGLYI